MRTIKELQENVKKVDKIITKKMGDFPYPELIRCLKAQEELGEVVDVLVRMVAGSRKGKMDLQEGRLSLGKELVDVIVLLVGLANHYGIDLEPIFEEKLGQDVKRYGRKGGEKA